MPTARRTAPGTPRRSALRRATLATCTAIVLTVSACSGSGSGGKAPDTNAEQKQGSAAQGEEQDNPGAGRELPPSEDLAMPESSGKDVPQAQNGLRSFLDVGPGQEEPEGSRGLSTFAIDIDTASYEYARRTIADGSLPAPETVRAEEFVNAFRQHYPEPTGNGFTVTADGARLPEWPTTAYGPVSEELRLLRVGLQTRSQMAATRPDAALTFVIDKSGSMAEPGRLDLVQDALHTLVDELRPTDSVAIVAYSDRARVVQPMTRISRRSALHHAIDELGADGSTNLEQGMVTGYRTAREGFREGATNRVILLSDGLANTGSTTAKPILRRVREEAGKGIALLCVGVGSEYGDALMERLADNGDGFAVYVSQRRQARKLFVSSLPATLTVRALDAKAQVRFNSDLVETYHLIGYQNRALEADDFRDDTVDGGEVGPGHSVTALYVVRLRPAALSAAPGKEVAEARVRWLEPQARVPSEAVGLATIGDLAGTYDSAPDRFRLAYTAAAFAETLRGQTVPTAGGADARRFLGTLAQEAGKLARSTEDRDVAGFATMVRQAIGRYGG